MSKYTYGYAIGERVRFLDNEHTQSVKGMNGVVSDAAWVGGTWLLLIEVRVPTNREYPDGRRMVPAAPVDIERYSEAAT